METSYSCRFWLEAIEQERDFYPAKFVRGQGRGGQKRNKTSNAAELKFHHLRAEASASRSKEKNWQDALHKLKIAIALDCTPHYSERLLPPELLQQRIASFRLSADKHPDFPKSLGCLIDVAINLGFDWDKLAASLGFTKSGLTKWFLDHPEVKKQLLELAYKDRIAHQDKVADQEKLAHLEIPAIATDSKLSEKSTESSLKKGKSQT